MKKLLFTTFALYLFQISSAQIIFQKAYGLNGGDLGYCVRQTSDGGYIITGKVRISGSVSHDDLYLIKTDANGDTLWTRIYGKTTTNEVGYCVRQTLDGGYIVTGNAYTAAGINVYLIKTNAGGDTLWTRTFGGTAADQGYDVRQTNDGGYIITGRTSSFGSGPDNVYLLKTDANGILTWTKTYGGPNPDYGNAVQQTADGGYIIGGVTYSFPPGDKNAYLIKTDTAGNLSWSKTFGGTADDDASAVQQTSDNGYILAGGTESSGSGGADVYLIKTDANGDTLWTKALGGTSYENGAGVQQTTDGGYIICGKTSSFGVGSTAVYLVKTDLGGNVIWSKTYGGAGSFQDVAYSVQQTADHGYVLTGFVTSFGVASDVYLIKTDSSGNTACNHGNPATILSATSTSVGNPSTTTSSGGTATTMITSVGNGCAIFDCSTSGVPENEMTNNIIRIYPNPNNGIFSVWIEETSGNGAIAEIFNTTGCNIYSSYITGNYEMINLSRYPAGIYFLQIQTENNSIIKKFIKY